MKLATPTSTTPTYPTLKHSSGAQRPSRKRASTFFHPKLFPNIRIHASHDASLNETLARVFKNIEGSAVGSGSEDYLKGLFDDLDVNSSKLGRTVAKRNEKLVKLLDAIGDQPLGNFKDTSIDLVGDAYEYLMQMYASSAGKSAGKYYTPQEISELLARSTVMPEGSFFAAPTWPRSVPNTVAWPWFPSARCCSPT